MSQHRLNPCALGRKGRKEEENKVTQFYPPGTVRKSECMTVEGGHEQGKPMSPVLSESLSVPLNNRSITLGNTGPSRIERN